MKKISKTKSLLGRIAYYFTWPGIFMIIKLQPARTRVVIRSKNKILLVKDWLGTGKWSLPGGGLKINEKPLAGAIREVREETGLKLDEAKLMSIGKLDLRSAGISFSAYCYVIYLEKQIEPQVTVREIAECEWFDINKLDGIKLSSSASQVLLALSKRPDLLE